MRAYIDLIEGAQSQEIRDPLAAFAADTAARHGLQSFLLYPYGTDIKLSSIIVPKGGRGSGAGTAALNDLCRYADEHGQRILLTPAQAQDHGHDGPTSRARLVRFYKRFGFKENTGRSRDFTVTAGMIREPKGGRLTESMTFSTDHTGYSHGQHDMHLFAERDGAVVGQIDYSLYRGEVAIKMIQVHPKLQRSGIGAALVRELQRLYPDAEIEWGMTTAPGEALRNRLDYDEVEIPEIRSKLDRMAALKTRLDALQRAWDGFDGSKATDAQRDALMAAVGDWNDIQSEFDRLEDETRFLKPTKRLVRPAPGAATHP